MTSLDTLAPGEGSGSQSSSVKTARKQGVSCDACKFRKVKCDRRTKIENRRANESEDSIACSVCSSHGLRCTYTQSAPRRRRGKRIVAIQQNQLHDLDEASAIRSLQENTQPIPNPFVSVFGKDFQVNQDLAGSGQYSGSASPTSHPNRAAVDAAPQGLLGVRGMTRALLDACVKGYFKYAAPCMPILHAEVFAARYALFFSEYERNKGIRPFWEIPQEDAQSVDRPLSVLLLLAVGCIGAALLEPPIADFGSKAKFRLQDRLAVQFKEDVNKHDLLFRLEHEGVDVIEACYIMSDPTLAVLGDDLPSRSAFDWEAIRKMDKSQRDPLRLRPTSHEGITRLLYKMNLNKSPKMRQDCPPGDNRLWDSGGVLINEREVFRRSRIFWSVFMSDSFRSMGERRSVLISNDDYDLDLPRFIPRQDGQFAAQFWQDPKGAKETNYSTIDFSRLPGEGEALNEQSTYILHLGNMYGGVARLQPSRFAKFDAYHFEVMLRLAFIIRTISIKFVSPRSQGKGVLVSDIERAVSALGAWYQQLPPETTWEFQSEPLSNALSEGKGSSTDAVAMRNSLRALFVEVLFHGNVLAVWASVDVFGTRADLDMAEAVSLFTSRLKLSDDTSAASPRASGLSNNVQSPSASYMGANASLPKPSEESRKEVRQKLDTLAAKSFLRISKMAKEAARLGLVRGNRLVFTNIFSSYAVWGCGLARKLSASGGQALGEAGASLLVDIPPGYNQIEYMFKCVENLIYAIGAMDSFEGAQDRAAQFKGLLQKSRESCQDTTSGSDARRRSSGAATTSSAAAAVPPLSSSSKDNEAAESPADAPFRYYFQYRGQKGFGDLSKSMKSKGSTRQPQDSKQAQTMLRPQQQPASTSSSVSPGNSNTEMDEVVQLANAAIPYDSGIESDSVSPTSDHKVGDTPESQLGGMDQALDLDLESITGMDTNWLHRYLQGSMPAMGLSTSAPHFPPPQHAQQLEQTQQQTFAPSIGAGYYHVVPPAVMSTSLSGGAASLYSAASLDPLPIDYTTAAGGDGAAAAGILQTPGLYQGVGIDRQWDQFMANADAQLWAESQWQGFNPDSAMN